MLNSCTFLEREEGVGAPNHIRTLTGHTRLCGGVISFSKNLRATAEGSGQSSVFGKGAGANTAGKFQIVNGAGFSGFYVYRNKETGLVTRFVVVPNAAYTEHEVMLTTDAGRQEFGTQTRPWNGIPIMVGARENETTQEEATRTLERPLGPRCLYKLNIKIAADCDDGQSYIQDIQGEFVQRFIQENGTIVLMFTNSTAETIDPASVVVVDTTETTTEAATVGDIEVLDQSGVEPETHAIVVREEDLPVVIEEVVNPVTGETEIVEVPEAEAIQELNGGSGPIVGEGGAGQAPRVPEVVYVEETSPEAQAAVQNIVPSEEVIVIGNRRYIPLYRGGNGSGRPRHGGNGNHRRRINNNGNARNYYPGQGWKKVPSQQIPGHNAGMFKPSARNYYPGQPKIVPALPGYGGGIYKPSTGYRNYGNGMRKKRYSGGGGGGPKNRAYVGFGTDVKHTNEWKWGRQETILTVVGILVAVGIVAYAFNKRKIQKEEAEKIAAKQLAYELGED